MILRSVTIGTAAGCEVRIHDDVYVSARHARIDQHDDGRYVLQDIGSMNGTWIIRDGRPNKIPLGGVDLLQPGDKVRVGRTEIPWAQPAA